ncbi:MAG: hypothetical protein H7296_14075 [Bacteroidia bacterium]|nr:hypothetical protein [Bacteroidia bacterium]
MMGQLEQKYRVYWNGCTNDEPGFSCWPSSGSYSNIKFCYSAPLSGEKDCYLNMEVQTPPSCLPCITASPYCVRLKAKCIVNGNDLELTLDDNDPNTPQITEFHYVINISGDPVMTICCSKTDQFGQIHTYCCHGDLTAYAW